MSQPLPAWLAGARMAPSAHNTQPWRFKLLPGGQALVGWDAARTLPAGDPTNRDLYLALGAAIESARLAAAANGHCVRFTARFTASERTLGSLERVGGSPDPTDRQLAECLSARRTARTAHLRRPLPPGLLTSLQREAEAFGCRLHLVLQDLLVGQLATLAAQATAAQFADPGVHAELWHWLRLNPNDPAYHRDGLTADCLNLKGVGLAVARLTMPPRRMRWLVRLRVHHLLAADTALLVRRSTALCLLTVPAAAPIDLVHTGRLLLRLWLIATAAGLSTHPVSALLDCTTTVGRTVSIFNADGETPAAIFRLGATPPVAEAPRLPADELLEVGGDTC
jgi:nitroreductase